MRGFTLFAIDGDRMVQATSRIEAETLDDAVAVASRLFKNSFAVEIWEGPVQAKIVRQAAAS